MPYIMLIIMMMQNQPFIQKVVGDFDRHSLYLVVNVKSDKYVGPVVIENNDFSYFFLETKRIGEKQYKTIMLDVLKNNKTVDLGTVCFKDWGFMPCYSSCQSNDIFGYDKPQLIEHYFKAGIIKSNVSKDLYPAIIFKLFYWNIGTKTDDESGCLMIADGQQ